MLYEEKRPPTGNVPHLTPDEVLWKDFKRGDELAFTRIYNSYSAMLYNYGCKYSADKEMVRDCLQDFFIYLRQNRLGFGHTNCIKFYLLKSFKRRIIEYLKQNNCRFNVDETRHSALLGVESSIEAVYINKQVKEEQLDTLNKALSTLDPIEQEAIYYFYFRGLSYGQIAEKFKFSHVSSVRRVMYRSIRHLRSFFYYS